MENITTERTPPQDDDTVNNYMETIDTAVIAIAIHCVGLCLIVPTFAMFVKYKSLRRKGNLFQLNLLVSDTVLLFSDWPLVYGTELGCELHAFVYLIFGAGSIFSSVLIALQRHETVTKSADMSCYIQTYPVLWTACLWLASLLTVVLPLHARFFPWERSLNNIACFFEASVLYTCPLHAALYSAMVILAPMVIIGYCYTRIYKYVRKARVDSWLAGVVVAYTRNTRINYSGNRPRTNIIPAVANTQPVYPSETVLNLSHREKTLLIKGFASIGIIVCLCAPFTISWLILSIHVYGFTANFMRQQCYLLLLAKCSIIAHVFIYIICNTKLKKYYKSTIFCACSRIISREARELNMTNNTKVNHIHIHERDTCDGNTTSPVINELYTLEATTDRDTLDITAHPTRISRMMYMDDRMKRMSDSARAMCSRHSPTVKPAGIQQGGDQVHSD